MRGNGRRDRNYREEMGTAKEEDKSSVGERRNKIEEEKNRTQGLVG